jgi:integrase
MTRSTFSKDDFRYRTRRLKLPNKKKPYKYLLAPGIFLCYRRNEGPGTWSVETGGWLKRFALADDREDANGTSVLSFEQAQKRALKMTRGSEAEADKPVTVGEAVDAFETDLIARGGSRYNATTVRSHLPSAMASKVVMLLSETELANWRNGLVTEGLKVSSANRTGKSLKAALALAAKRDKRITNSLAWKNGLRPLKVKGGSIPPRDNYYLEDSTIHKIVRECYVENAELGAAIDTLATTGTRESQMLKVYPRDLLDADMTQPRLMLWCSNKGRDRDPEQRAVSITPRLAQMLRKRANVRGANRPLFDRISNMSARFRVVLERLKLDPSLSPYTLRHSSIIRQIRAGTPLRMIAFAHDTSVGEIERTYARHLNSASDDLLRKGLLSEPEPTKVVDNVIPLAR